MDERLGREERLDDELLDEDLDRPGATAAEGELLDEELETPGATVVGDVDDETPPPGIAVNETPDTAARPEAITDVDIEQEEGRFSRGQEQLPETPEEEVERRFSEGQERDPYSE